MYKPGYNAFYNSPEPLPFYWNRVIPATLDDALTYDAMFARLLYTVNAIIDNQYLTVPYLINTSFTYTTEAIHITGMLYQDYTLINIDQEFTVNGMNDGTYYINIYNDSMNKVVGKLKDKSGVLFLSTEYMPMNCTTLYMFDVVGGKIVGDTIMFNDLYTHMHNFDPNAHKALFDGVNARIDQEIEDRKAADNALQDNINAETAARKAADAQLQSNIDTEKAAREAADDQLQANIDAEAQTRANADTNLQNQITSNDADITQLRTDLTTETSARTSADTALSDRITANTNAITTETEQRQAQDATLNNNINNHIADKANPHQVTKEQIGLGNVPNGPFVNSVNSISGAVTIAGSGSASVTNSGQNVTVNVPAIPNATTVNGIDGNVQIVAGANMTVTPDATGKTITLTSSGGGETGGVPSVNNITDSVTINGSGATTVSTAGNIITVNSPVVTPGVPSVNGESGAITISGGGTTTVTNSGGNITVSTPAVDTGVVSLNSQKGALTITGSGATTVTNTGGSFTVSSPVVDPGVTAITAGEGISVSGNTGNVTINNIGIRSILSNAGIEAQTESGVTSLFNTGVLSVNGITGAPYIVSTDGITDSVSSNIITLSGPVKEVTTAVNVNTLVEPGTYMFRIPPLAYTGLPENMTTPLYMNVIKTGSASTDIKQIIVDTNCNEYYRNGNSGSWTQWNGTNLSVTFPTSTGGSSPLECKIKYVNGKKYAYTRNKTFVLSQNLTTNSELLMNAIPSDITIQDTQILGMGYAITAGSYLNVMFKAKFNGITAKNISQTSSIPSGKTIYAPDFLIELVNQ